MRTRSSASPEKVVPLFSPGPRFPVRQAAAQRPRLIVIDHAKAWAAAIALAAVALIGVGAFADRLLIVSQSFACFAPPTVPP